MVRSAMAGSGKDFAEGRKRGKSRLIKNESNGRASPAEAGESENSRQPNFE